MAGSQTQTLEAGWRAGSVEGGGAVPRVKLGDQLPELEVRAKDSSNQVRAGGMIESVQAASAQSLLLARRGFVFLLLPAHAWHLLHSSMHSCVCIANTGCSLV